MTKTQRGAANPALIIVGALVGLVVLVVGAFAIQWVTAEPRGALDQREKTIADGNYRIAAYDSFYDQCGAIQALEDQIATAEDRPASDGGSNSGWTQTQKDATIQALKNSRAEAVRQYNADATKADTKANFLASDLPYQIDLNGVTTCAAS